MPKSLNIGFIRAAGSSTVSDIFENERYDVAVLQVESTADAFSVALEGRVDAQADWTAVASANVSVYGTPFETMTEDGIYEFGVAGLREIRVRVISVTNGSVSVSGVFWNSADNTPYPKGSPFTFRDPKLFVKGAAEVIFTDPKTGAICGYEKVLSDAAVQSSVNLGEITGGIGNRLVGVIPDSARITGSYTDEAFSLRTRAAIMGGNVAYNASVPICEKATSESSVLKVSRSPAHSPAQNPEDALCLCYVREAGTQSGINYGVHPDTREIEGFTANPGTAYEVSYFVHNPSARSLAVPTEWNPVAMCVTIRYGVYRRQGPKDSHGAFYGWMMFIVPLAILTGDAGVDGAQTAHTSSSGTWTALPDKQRAMPMFTGNATPVAYYVLVPCADTSDLIEEIVLPGGGVTVKVGQRIRLPLKVVTAGDEVVTPDYRTINYISADDGIAAVDEDGYVTGVKAGETVVTAFVLKKNGTVTSTVCSVSVSGENRTLSTHRSHIIIEP